MADATIPSTRRQRKSLGGNIPSAKSAYKENATVDLSGSLAANRKKSRSKSMGPGGLDVLKNGSGNRRASLAAPSRPPPRSILKPTMAALAEIPPLKRKSTVGSPKKNRSDARGAEQNGSSGAKVAVRTEEEQQAAAREREERERREARRKSLANRRVSFAAEATLHTFHEIEYMQDSTSSTDSTRRASSVANATDSQSKNAEKNTSPRKQEEAEIEGFSENQRDLHQRKRRRSSGVSAVSNFSQPDDNTIASSYYSSDSEPADDVEEIQEEEDSNSSSDSDSADEGTMMTVEEHEVTGASVMSAMSSRSESGSGDNDTLDQALRMASNRAGTQNVVEDDSDGEEVIPSFGWIKKDSGQQHMAQNGRSHLEQDAADDAGQDETGMDMDMTNAVGGIYRQRHDEETGEQDMSMEVTRPVGGILHQERPRESDFGIQQSDSGETMQVDQTMELTRPLGKIQHPAPQIVADEEDANEDMSMELTTAVGGFLQQQKERESATRHETMASTNGNRMGDFTLDMDMTVGVGRILPGTPNIANEDEPEATAEMDMDMDMTVGAGRILSGHVPTEDEGDATMGMDMTTAVGGIIGQATPTQSRAAGKKLLEQEVDKPDTPSKSMRLASKSPAEKLATATKSATNGLEPSSASRDPFRGQGLRRSLAPDGPASVESSPFNRTPSPQKPERRARSRSSSPQKTASPKKAASPSKAAYLNVAPSSNQGSSPIRTPQSPSKTSAGRSRLPDSRPSTPSTAKAAAGKTPDLSQRNSSTGARTPSVVLTPQSRRLSGLGADRAGLGSPQVAAIFDRRESIGESAQEFVPGKSRGVTFADPRSLEDAIDRERQAEADKENGRKILECEADGQNETESTLTLKEMIESMSPKRAPLKGRKSLHVGSAKGVLGKRPAELDDEEGDEREDRDGIKRLKNHQGSPVKNVRLQQPPSKAETTGRRLTRSTLSGDAEGATPSQSASPLKTATTPREHGRFRNVMDDTATHSMNLDRTPIKNEASLEIEQSEDRIHLQDFLNLTSIRFMELTTTKRRHTQAPEAFTDGFLEGEGSFSLERRVVAGASTIPMLELYQHSCRELKKYISEGRRIVREIETETFEENPPLFHEYMSASPDIKNLLDNQFKNVKTHARLESKAMWYQWRMALQEGLKEGLVRIEEDMAGDETLLKQQEKLLSSVFPQISSRFDVLEEERNNLETAAQELADCDPSELESARRDLTDAEVDIEEKQRRIAELRQELQESEDSVELLARQKGVCHDEIQEAEKIREECRGWSTSEISSLKARVDAIEEQHGWAITGISGSAVTMTYRRELRLILDTASLGVDQGQRPSQIEFDYIGDERDSDAKGPGQETDFFVGCIRDHVQSVPQSRAKISYLLHVVCAAWDSFVSTRDDIRRLNITFPTKVTRNSDTSIAVCSSLMLAPIETRVEAVLEVRRVSSPSGLDFTLNPEARVLYGEQFNVGKMGEFLSTHLGSNIGGTKTAETASWSDVLVDLHGRLLAKGRKSS